MEEVVSLMHSLLVSSRYEKSSKVFASFTVTNGVDNVSLKVANIGGAVKSINSWMSVDIANLAGSIGIKVFSSNAKV